MSDTTFPPQQRLTISQLKIDRLYRRGVDEKFVREIMHSFNSIYFGLPLVAIRGGEYYIVDGLQRIEAAKCRGERQVPCKVFESNGPAEEAKAYLMLHNRLGLSSTDMNKAKNCLPGH